MNETHHIGDACTPPHRSGRLYRRRYRLAVKCDPNLPHVFTEAGDLVSCPPACPTVARTSWTCSVCGDVVESGETCPRGDGGTRPAPTVRGR